MSNFSNLTQVGRLTADPIERQTKDGDLVCNFTVATNRKIGEDREETLFMDWSAFGKNAETIAKFFSKGKTILVSGNLRTEKWEKDGYTRSKVVGRVQTWAFIGPKGDEAQPETMAATATATPPSAKATDEIPF